MSDLSDYQNLRRNHPGWCTIESEPAIFNQILRDAGVTNTRVIELYSLDESILDEPETRVKSDKPPGRTKVYVVTTIDIAIRSRKQKSVVPIAFENSCGSLAMINILFNAESVVLGEELAQLKSFTAGLTPPLRGLCLRNSEFLRKNHNSFARRSEIMQNNLDVIDSCKNTKGLANDNGLNTESAYHFIAYVPSGGSVWELDGLKRQPVEIGETDSTSRWLLTAMPRVQLQISKYSENELMFTLLALTQCTTTSHERPAMRMTSLGKDTLFPYATRVRHPYAAFMRHYIQVLAGKGIQVGYS
ncbi:hypothetical protein TWF788_008437 [Orbilia oligospora]|uniref:ubiquitinyl hydrolase 1 n=1 Tax=Orbilia oligospora TaxID=2813651 RepID=A0A6G1LWC9_ORBOL|nr:hypothetical protein TWF788_008437 [Orbilia oligospora]KAF3199227.1 hypothetical protein TWF679_001556 [Orbilia oligospora]KAF3206153.1 hypothetical protein TWF191_001504 [Orbilia oligospora]KAF3236436.1 hypothetical protein TWF192_011409 [Orbilia oligospora]